MRTCTVAFAPRSLKRRFLVVEFQDRGMIRLALSPVAILPSLQRKIVTDQAVYKFFVDNKAIRVETGAVFKVLEWTFCLLFLCVAEIQRRCAFAVHAE